MMTIVVVAVDLCKLSAVTNPSLREIEKETTSNVM